MLKEEFKERDKRELLVTFALKDGKEITGLLRKRKALLGMFYVPVNSNEPNAKIFIFKHAVDDFWVEE